MVFLNGRLDVVVVEGRQLLNLDTGLLSSSSSKSDPYCIVALEGINGSRRIGKTHTIDDNLNPKWFYKIITEVNQDISGIKFTVKDKDFVGSEVIGTAFLDTLIFIGGKKYNGLLHLTSPKKKPAGSIKVQVIFSGTSSEDFTAASVTDKIRIKRDDFKGRFVPFSSKYKTGVQGSVFLHGIIFVHIDKAVNLPNLDSSILSIKKKDVSDPYINLNLEDVTGKSWKVATTSVIDDNLNPIWDERFQVDVCHDVVAVDFTIRDKDFISSDVIGSLAFKAEDLIKSGKIDGSFSLSIKGKIKDKSKLFLSIEFLNVKQLIASPEVPNCYFGIRQNNRVVLYQDAHCYQLPGKPAGNSLNNYYPRRAWLDVYNTIINAKEFIYLIGWSINRNVSLLRWKGEDARSLGEILMQKSDEGVDVQVMIWDELTSTEFNPSGAMGTSDEDTFQYFKHSKVNVTLASRERKTETLLTTKEKFTNFCYSHHQKCVIADGNVEGFPGNKQAIAYVGGLDLTNGRFDTPHHWLFNTLTTDHANDFYQKVFDTKANIGPREPWHDIHCRVEGSIVLDLIENFRQRYFKQGNKERSLRLSVPFEQRWAHNFSYSDNWNAQLFRSINSDSVFFNPSFGYSGLFNKKGRLFENSIQRAYIHQIRRAKKYLYIENQYFMGSSHAWLDCRDAAVSNLIPLEIVSHIEEKIMARERFVAYILVPMFPEGKPGDKVIQEILHWQFRTIEMMYRRVADAIQEMGFRGHPQDYLLFFCLGKKEAPSSVNFPDNITPHASSAIKNGRIMIYVHSKMAIFDDEYAIVGSANINDRSLSGNRDTEIAVGSFQPNHMAEGNMLPKGEIANFRKSLWLEHMGSKAPLDDDPSTLSCARYVRELAEEGLQSHIDLRTTEGIRNLLLYPLSVETDGSVKQRLDCPYFPDTNAKVSGGRSGYIPTKLTS